MGQELVHLTVEGIDRVFILRDTVGTVRDDLTVVSDADEGPVDCVFWAHGHGRADDMPFWVSADHRRIDAFPRGLLSAQAAWSDAMGYVAGHPQREEAEPTWAPPGQDPNDPRTPFLRSVYAPPAFQLDQFHDLEFMCSIVDWLLAQADPMLDERRFRNIRRFWFAGTSKGGVLGWAAYAFNGASAELPQLASLSQFLGYFLACAGMPRREDVYGVAPGYHWDINTIEWALLDPIRWPVDPVVRTPLLRSTVLWHGGADTDTVTQRYDNCLEYDDSAVALLGAHAARWNDSVADVNRLTGAVADGWRTYRSRPRVCAGFDPYVEVEIPRDPPGVIGWYSSEAGLVKARLANLAEVLDPTMVGQFGMVAPEEQVMEYEVNQGGHGWTFETPLCAAPAGPDPWQANWDEAVVATDFFARVPRTPLGS